MKLKNKKIEKEEYPKEWIKYRRAYKKPALITSIVLLALGVFLIYLPLINPITMGWAAKKILWRFG